MKYLTTKEIALKLGIEAGSVWRRFKSKDILPCKEVAHCHYYSEEKVNLITPPDKQIIIYYPYRIETIYHIYESKMNYIPNL